MIGGFVKYYQKICFYRLSNQLTINAKRQQSVKPGRNTYIWHSAAQLSLACDALCRCVYGSLLGQYGGELR